MKRKRGAPKRLPEMHPTTIWLDQASRDKLARINTQSRSEAIRMAIREYPEGKCK